MVFPDVPAGLPSIDKPSNVMEAISPLSSGLMMEVKNSVGFSADQELCLMPDSYSIFFFLSLFTL